MSKQFIKYIHLLNLLIICFCVISCNIERMPIECVLFDFESDHELDEVHWKCHTLMNLSDQHVAHGAGSLKLDLYPSNYPGFNPFTKIHDWSPFKALCFDVYNPDDREHRLTVRIDDREDNTEYGDRYNNGFILKKGMNHIEIKMDSLITSGTKRKMDVSKIDKFMFFIYKPTEKVVLYVDYVRLVKS